MNARYDMQNPTALKRLVAGGTQLRPFTNEVLEACLKATNELWAEISGKNADFKKSIDAMQAYRSDQYLWWQVAEYTYDSFMVVESHGLPIVEDACEALGAVHADGVPVGGRGHPAAFGFYANKQLTTGEGGMLTLGSAEHKARVDSERNQGRAPDMGWLDHDRLGFNYRLTDIQAAIGLCQLDRLDGMLADRAKVAGRYREALAGLEGLELPCEDAGGDVRGWFVFVVQVPRGADRDTVIRGLRERGVQSKPYLPAIHLMSYYRETFGHRPGEFPVCEDVAERSVALPFFPAMTEGQVARVAEALARVLGERRPRGPGSLAGVRPGGETRGR